MIVNKRFRNVSIWFVFAFLLVFLQTQQVVASKFGQIKIKDSAGAVIDPLEEGTFTGRVGEVQVSPTENTVLDRLKDISVNQTNSTHKTQVVNSVGDAVGITNNALDVHVSDVHRSLLNRYMTQFSGTTSNLNVNASIGSTDLTVVSDAAFSAGDWIYIHEGATEENNFLKVTAKPGGNVLTLDRPLDNAYTTITPAIVELVYVNMALFNGSLVTPVSFTIQPPSDEVWHMRRLLLTLQDNTVMDTSKFGGGTVLTYGIVVRVDNNGVKYTITNWKSNADFMEDSYDVTFHDKAPAGNYGLAMRWSPDKVDAYIRLDGATNDYLEVLIQDSLTGLVDCQIKVQGHKEE